ncbi:Ulp1 protease family, carboxy-terminal domain protein (macronuclear) [Tetrahymena thermophila SB210]|uniref:Ulp1 protease family, carboxy-terminal domain protein n=1 Tax=Tetrahymena thermophila (strain SB210) TaxID=312017 RepID=I7M397_TETTS|nr:Ulp1 protease family, carboxy-terminal domain protein [Tetrahymena thermophila SB210]EAS02730.2 Ulp1 protease family, carboxy-terminal domain protein [Tetrahymena thermophila SB210]|eukprot:XP_001022975.2 Ulp1 protease family, carboxy-terminal domain protein [Tetrahymena thermophila SB210]
MKSKFLDTLFDNILNWLGPKKRKRDDISIGEYDGEYPRIPDPSKKVFKSSDQFSSSNDQKLANNNNNSSSANQSSDDVPQIIHSVIPIKNNTSPRKEAQYQQINKKDIIDHNKENSNTKVKLQNQPNPKVIVLNECNGNSKKNEFQLNGKKEAQLQEFIVIEEDGIEQAKQNHNQDKQLQLARRPSSAQYQIEQDRKQRENLDLEIIQLPKEFMEFKEITDEWISNDFGLLEQKMAKLDLQTQQIKQKTEEGRKKNGNNNQVDSDIIFIKQYHKKSKVGELLEEFNQIYDLKTKKMKKLFWRFEEKQLKEVQDVFERSFNLNQDVVTHQHILERLTFSNLQTLRQPNWLNDEVINAYIRLIVQSTNAVILNTFFYPELVKNSAWNKIKRIATKNKVTYKSGNFFVPMNINGTHWSFVEVNNETNKIIYYDSLATDDRDYFNYTKYFVDLMQNLQKDDGIAQENIKKYELINGETGFQQNGYDCGVFMLKGIHYRSSGINGLRLWIEQTDTQYYRYLIAFQLIQGKVEICQN